MLCTRDSCLANLIANDLQARAKNEYLIKQVTNAKQPCDDDDDAGNIHYFLRKVLHFEIMSRRRIVGVVLLCGLSHITILSFSQRISLCLPFGIVEMSEDLNE